MRSVLLLLLNLSFFTSSFAQDDSLKILLYQGVALHDKADYEGAIRTYDEIIRRDNNYYLAYNEKSLSLFRSGKYQERADLCKAILKRFRDSSANRNVYVNYGSSVDAMDKSDDAIKIYNEGIKKYPDYYLLPFNKGITEYQHKDLDAAVVDFKKSVRLKPDHASSHQFLAYSIYEKNKMAAVLSLSTFLLLEPEGKRAEKNLKVMLKLLGSNVEKKDDKNITISLTPGALNTKESGEDDFHLAEVMISMRSALDYDDKYKDLPPSQGLKDKLEMLIFSRDDKKTKKKGFFTNFYIPFLQEMKAANLLETACHIMYSSSDNPANKNWLAENKGKVDEFNQWMGAYAWNKE
jgi:tetratricopeptide (TPR) repeat protein